MINGPEHRPAHIDPKTIGFDIDGVVADTMTLFLEIAKNEFHVNHIQYDDITSYSLNECLEIDGGIIDAVIDRLLSGRYDESLKPVEGAVRVLRKLGTEYPPVRLVTARPSPESIQQWILNTVKLTPPAIDLVATGAFEAKADVLRERRIAWFVEDRLETCYHLEENGISPILFKQPWNRKNHLFHEVESWRALESMIAF